MQLHRHDWRSVLFGATVSISGATAVSLIWLWVTGTPAGGSEPPDGGWLLWSAYVVSAVLLAPLVETAGLAGVFYLLRGKLGDRLAGGIVVLVFAGLHSALQPVWGLIVLIPGIVFVLPFLKVASMKDAMLRSGMTHSLHNMLALVFITASA